MKKIIALIISIALITGVLSGCSAAKSETTTPAAQTTASSAEDKTTSTTSSAAQTTEQPRSYLDDLTLNALDGTTVQLSSIAKKYTVIAFWATWCQYCIEEIPILTKLQERDDVQVIMLNSGEKLDDVKEFVESNGITLDVFYDEDSSVATQYGVSGFPTLMFITEELEAMGIVPGKIDEANFLEIFDIIDEFRTERGDKLD